MSLPIQAVDRLFTRLSATYGASWDRSLGQAPITDVKTVWAHELSGYAQNLAAIAWALENLPDTPPNVLQFRAICRRFMPADAPRLPEPKADPERVRAELAKLGELRASVGANSGGGKEWARRIIHRHQMCERINPTTLRFARQALGLEAA